MNLSTWDHVVQGHAEALEIDPASIYTALEKVKDGRKSKGKRYLLALILTLLLLGKLAGGITIDAIIDWTNYKKNDLKKLLNRPKRFLSNKTYIRALSSCNDEEIVEILAGVIEKTRVKGKCGDEQSRLVIQRENEKK